MGRTEVWFVPSREETEKSNILTMLVQTKGFFFSTHVFGGAQPKFRQLISISTWLRSGLSWNSTLQFVGIKHSD